MFVCKKKKEYAARIVLLMFLLCNKDEEKRGAYSRLFLFSRRGVGSKERPSTVIVIHIVVIVDVAAQPATLRVRGDRFHVDHTPVHRTTKHAPDERRKHRDEKVMVVCGEDFRTPSGQ